MAKKTDKDDKEKRRARGGKTADCPPMRKGGKVKDDKEKRRARGGPISQHKRMAEGDAVDGETYRRGGKAKEKRRAKGGKVGGLVPNSMKPPSRGAAPY